MSHWRDLLMLNKLRAPVGNMQIFIRIRIRILHVVQSADPQSADPHFTHSLGSGYGRWHGRWVGGTFSDSHLFMYI